ncbi:hypothetical protein GCM10007147_24280 [Nocardiopsis kunsanensis]|uniref:Uncharacterized protein n=1 Tax=Nocardiopsis kunsanensis TaxID=141693 RepID=A0A918XCV2_9ACTN|nr:hypothetical protein GCM10007147_24280 [Nocardiopsis kunsanensis]
MRAPWSASVVRTSRQPDPGQAVLAHHADDLLVVDPCIPGCSLIVVSGDPGRPVRGITAPGGALQGVDAFGQGQVRALACRTLGFGPEPGVEGGPGQAQGSGKVG